MNGKTLWSLSLAISLFAALAQTAAAAPRKALTWEQQVGEEVAAAGRGGKAKPAPRKTLTWEQWLQEAVAKGGRDNWRTLGFLDLSQKSIFVHQMISVHFNEAANKKGQVVLFQIRDLRKNTQPNGYQLFVTDVDGEKLYKASILPADSDDWQPQDPTHPSVLKAFAAMKDYWLKFPGDRTPYSPDFDEDVAVSWKELVEKTQKEGYSSGDWKTINFATKLPETANASAQIFSVAVSGAHVGTVVIDRWGGDDASTSMLTELVYVTDAAGLKASQVLKRTTNLKTGEIGSPAPSKEESSEGAFIAKKKMWLSAADLASGEGLSGDFDWIFAPATPAP